jgi:hypothetical protein
MNRSLIKTVWSAVFPKGIREGDYDAALNLVEKLSYEEVSQPELRRVRAAREVQDETPAPAKRKQKAKPTEKPVRFPRLKGLRKPKKMVTSDVQPRAEKLRELLKTGPATTRELAMMLWDNEPATPLELNARQTKVLTALAHLRAKPVERVQKFKPNGKPNGFAYKYALPEPH